MVEEIGKNNFEQKVLKSKMPVILDFWAEWCSPCKMLAPTFEKLSKELKQLSFFKLNIEENTKLAQDYDVMSIPCLILFKEGREVERFVGTMSYDSLKEKILSAV